VKTLKNPKLLLAAILIGIIAIIPIPHAYSSTLTLTIFTTKPSYTIGEEITIYGNLTYNGSPVPDWSIAIEVQDPVGTPLVTRTLQTDTSGTYTITFKLPTNAKLGTYTAYVSSNYKGETDTNNTTFELIPVRDIAVTNLTLSKTVVGQGYSMNITVTIENQGENSESFNVTVYCNETAIILPDGKNHTTVTLPSGYSTTITLMWNTTGVAHGNYTISAYAWPLTGESDLEDNTYTNGWIVVTIPGDMNGDFDVDLYDAVTLLVHYGAKKGNPQYSAVCDIDGDGDIDLYDAVILLTHYGQKYT
jgi:hypothetical protein